MLLYLPSILLLWITLSSVIQGENLLYSFTIELHIKSFCVINLAKQAVPSIAIPRGKNRKNVAIGYKMYNQL